jgi:hypothetical protein
MFNKKCRIKNQILPLHFFLRKNNHFHLFFGIEKKKTFLFCFKQKKMSFQWKIVEETETNREMGYIQKKYELKILVLLIWLAPP